MDDVEKLYKCGFSADDIKCCEANGWTAERIASRLKQLDADGVVLTLETTRATFEEAHPEAFGLGACQVDQSPHPSDDSVFSSFHFYSVPDLSEAERRPPEFLIEGMLPCGMTVLSGAPKIRKSFFALQLAIAVATGQPFFGRKTTQCDVVYFDLEGSKGRISSRTAQMSTEIPRNVYVANRLTEKLSDGLVEKLRFLHWQRPSIRLIIIDTYSRAKGGTPKGNGANAYDQDVAFLEPIQRMALDENIAILFTTHDKKGASLMSDSFERLSGTMGISGSADCVMNLIADGDRADGKAQIEVNPRDAKGFKLQLAFDNRCLEWQQIEDTKASVIGNPVCNWIVSNVPPLRQEGQFFPYEFVFAQAYHANGDRPGEKVREQVEKYRDELFSSFGIGVQIGVQSHGKRGIRVVNLK